MLVATSYCQLSSTPEKAHMALGKNVETGEGGRVGVVGDRVVIFLATRFSKKQQNHTALY